MRSQTTKKVDVRVKKTFAKLLETFFELIKTVPFEDISVIDICQQAGVHRATFYKHFVDKQDFVNFCFNAKLEGLEFGSDADILIDGKINIDEIVLIVRKIIEFVNANKRVIADLNASHTSSNAFGEAATRALSEIFEKKLLNMRESGLNIISPIPMLAHFFSGAIVETLNWWSIEGEAYTEEDIIKFVIRRLGEFDYTTQNKR